MECFGSCVGVEKWKVMNWPHNVIVDRCNKGEPLMVRYYLTPKILGFRLVLHKFLRSDNNRFFHDHPWNFITFIFKGPGYFEHQPNGIFFRKDFQYFSVERLTNILWNSCQY